MSERIVIASDHAGFELKCALLSFLEGLGYIVKDVGVYDNLSADYPLMAQLAVKEILENRAGKGILICGTGVGMSIAANRHKGIRAALCSDEYSARFSRAHNNANVLTLGGRVIGPALAASIAKIFLSTPFEGERHKRRVDIIENLESEFTK